VKEIKTDSYNKIAQNQTDKGLGNMFGDMSGDEGAFGVKKKYVEYAQEVIGLINQGVSQQEAFNKVMTDHQVVPSAKVFRQGVIDAVKQLYNQQQPQQPQQPSFNKSYDQQYPTPAIPQNRQMPV